jgi:hypothetical protein
VFQNSGCPAGSGARLTRWTVTIFAIVNRNLTQRRPITTGVTVWASERNVLARKHILTRPPDSLARSRLFCEMA